MKNNLIIPILTWAICFCLLTIVKFFGKWHLSGYVALIFFLILPVVIERSDDSLGLVFRLKDNIIFSIICLLVFGSIYFFALIFVKEFEFFEVKISPRLPTAEDLKLFFVMLVGVAFPEELFFRGFMQGRFNSFFGKNFSLLGVKFGYGLILSSIFFMLIHIPQSISAVRFLTFFPGVLFGFIKEKYGSIFPSVILHTVANMFMFLVSGT